MKAGWGEKRLIELCEIRPNKKGAKEKLRDTDLVSFVGMKEIGELESSFKARENRELSKVYKGYTYFADGDVIVAKITPCFENGKMGIASNLTNGVGFGSSEFVPLRSKGEITPEFLFYFLLRDEFRESGARVMSGAVGHKRVPKDYLEELPIPLPPLEEQKRIVAILDKAFEGLDRARAHTEVNLQNAKELFAVILDEVVLGKLNRPIGISSNANVSSVERFLALKQEIGENKRFRNPRVTSQKKFPDLPQTWTWASPEQLSTFIVDCLHTTPKWTDSGQYCLRTNNFKPFKLETSNLRFVSNETYSTRIKRLEPQPGDVLYSREGGILGIACMHPRGLKACLGQRMMQFRLKSEYILPEFFCGVLNSNLVLREVNNLVGGAAAPHLNIGDIRRFPIPLPPLSEQKIIIDRLQGLLEKAEKLNSFYQTKLSDLDDLRQSLLQKAFAGELT